VSMTDTQFTSDEDLAAGWTDSDWMQHTKLTGENKLGEPGGVERWRFQLDRRLTPAERNKVALRDEEYHDPETQGFDINKLLTVIRDVAPDVRVERARIGGQQAQTIGEWIPRYNHETGMALHSMDGFHDLFASSLLTYDQFKERAGECTQGPIR
jgi:hypothetical protein